MRSGPALTRTTKNCYACRAGGNPMTAIADGQRRSFGRPFSVASVPISWRRSDDNQAGTVFRCGGGGARAFAVVPIASAGAAARGAVAIDGSRHRRRRHRPERAGSRRLGDRRDHRPADQIRQDRGHRRSAAATSSPICPRPTTTCGCAATGSSIRRRSQGTPGKLLNLTAVPAPTQAAAAEYYPGMYWYSMLKIPDKSEFPGTGAKGNGIPSS